MPFTPSWEAARNGLPGHLNATNHAAQVNQFLGTHGITPIYEGNQLVTPNGGPNFTWAAYGNAIDLAQPFTMPGGHTSIGRVTIPIQVAGSGSDLLVALYPDNGSGSPNTSNLLSATLVPAAHIDTLTAPTGLSNGGPLAAARFNTNSATGGDNFVTWAAPAGYSGGVAISACATTSGDFIITAGGSDMTPAAVGTVVTTEFLGGTSMALSVPQPSIPLPTYYAGITALSNTVVYVGGQPTSGSTTNVWSASWDANTGVIGSWSLQTALPTPLTRMGVASYGNTVYVVGGFDGGGTLTTSVILNTFTNGQGSSWIAGPPLPVPLSNMVCTVIGNWLIAAGGNISNVSIITPSTGLYYARISPTDGSIDYWRTGPSLPTATAAYQPGWCFCVTDNVLNVVMGPGSVSYVNQIQSISFDDAGPADQWYSITLPHATATQVAAFPLGSGSYRMISLNFPNNDYDYTTLIPAPMLSVPLPASGLTPGSTYHVVLRQRGGPSTSDYLSYGLNSSALPADAKKSTRYSGTWTTAQAGYSVPMAVYDNTVGGPILHTWEDPSSTGSTYTSNLAARASTLVYNRYKLPLGLCEAAALPNDALNSNPTFTSGTTPWTATNCTLTQSSAQTHGGYAFSGLITPNGTSATVNAQSENVPVTAGASIVNPGRFYQVNGWVYSPTGWSSVSLSVAWYDRAGTLLSTSSNPVSVSAATWTNLVNYFQPPLNATYASINPTESGTPAAANLLYLSNVTLTVAPESAGSLAPVSEVNYSAGVWPPSSVTQLA